MHMFSSSHRLVRLSTILGVVFIALLTIFISYSITSNIKAEGEGALEVCGGTTSAFLTKPGQGQVVDGLMQLELYSSQGSQTPPLMIDSVEFFRDNNVGLGGGSPVSGNNSLWGTQWPSTSVSNGPHTIYAVAHYDNSYKCRTPYREIDVQNSGATTQTELRINVLPDDSWSGPTNVNFQFQAQAILVDETTNSFIDDVSDVANFSWTTSIGAINQNGYIGNFFSGPAPGSGEIILNAQFDGHVASETVVVSIFDANDPSAESDYDDYFGDPDSTGGESGGDGSTDNSGPGSASEEPDEVFPIPEDPNKVDYKLAQCLQERLGDDDYEQVLNDQVRLSKEQFDEVYDCFSTRRFVIPASIAPVAPSTVLELKEQQNIARIDEHKQVETQEGAVGIQFTGIAEPDSPILIYIFSEPLVLAGQTDSDGNWTYTLEDPLEPGKHEAYVVVDTDEGYVRSSSFGFEVAQASASEENPYGYSLALVENDTSQFRNYFIFGVVAMVLVASIVLTRFVWFRPRKTVPVAQVTPSPIESKASVPEVELKDSASDLPHQPGDIMHPEVEKPAAKTTATSDEGETPAEKPEESNQEPSTESDNEVPRQL